MRYLRLTRLLLILIAFACARQALAAEAGLLGPSVNESKTRWTTSDPAQIKASNAPGAKPGKVRIGMRLTPFKKVVTRLKDGKTDTRFIPGEALRHTLRARLNEANHFYVGDWHVETIPVSWIRKTNHYEVKLNLYRRYGEFGQLEESVGSVLLSGVLEPQDNNTHVLVGVARQRLRDSFGNPYLDVVAGYQPNQDSNAALTFGAPDNSATPNDATRGITADAVRGRF